MSERDTQFQGFAKLLLREMENKAAGMSPLDYSPTAMEKVKRDVIARRAYDLVMHTLIMLDLPEHINDIPDLKK